jgi:hypothetical protein
MQKSLDAAAYASKNPADSAQPNRGDLDQPLAEAVGRTGLNAPTNSAEQPFI